MSATLSDVREMLGGPSPAYLEKQRHPVPDLPVMERERFILERVKGKRVFELGASGKLHDAMVKVAAQVVGVDRLPSNGVMGFDLDDVSQPSLPVPPPIEANWTEVVVAGEVIEHLANPGYLLQRLRRQVRCPVIITVPNAFSRIAQHWIAQGIESVNADHVAWYSWKTLNVLLGRYGFTVTEAYWYHGPPRLAEGLIVVTE